MIKNFEYFLNEGLFSNIFNEKVKFSGDENKEDDDVAIWIINHLKLNGVDESNFTYDFNLSPSNLVYKRAWKYLLFKKGKFNPMDPYGEDDWGDNYKGNRFIEILIYEYGAYYYMCVKNQKLDVSKNLIKIIIKLLNEPREKRYEEEQRIRKERENSIKRELRKDLFEKNIVKSINEDPYNEEYWDDFDDDIFAFINNLVETYNVKYGHIYDCVFSAERKDDGEGDNRRNYGGKGAVIKINNREVLSVYDLPGQNNVAISGGTLKYPYFKIHMGYYNYNDAKKRIRSKLLGITKVINKVKQ